MVIDRSELTNYVQNNNLKKDNLNKKYEKLIISTNNQPSYKKQKMSMEKNRFCFYKVG